MKARWKCSPKGVFGLVAVLTATAGLFGAQDFRPPFDKRDYAGRVGIQLNPWFPPKKPPMHASGGPNVPYLHHEGTELQVWRQAMDLCARYGVDVLVPEINEPRAWTWQWRVLLQAAALTNDPPVKVGMFFGMYSKDKDAVIASMKKVLGPFREDLRSNPAVNRAGGHPVMVIYNPLKFKSAEWKEIFDALDAEFGRMVYLFNMNSLAVKVTQQCGDNASQDARFEKLLREMLPYWDGISSYGTGFRVPFGVIRKVMADFPQKINEGEAFLTYLNHFQTGGSEVELSETAARSSSSVETEVGAARAGLGKRVAAKARATARSAALPANPMRLLASMMGPSRPILRDRPTPPRAGPHVTAGARMARTSADMLSITPLPQAHRPRPRRAVCHRRQGPHPRDRVRPGAPTRGRRCPAAASDARRRSWGRCP